MKRFGIRTTISLLADWGELAEWIEELQSKEPSYTTSFTHINPDSAQTISNSKINLTIVDVRSCKCSYDKGHIPDAIWNKYPEEFYNVTNDLLIYCADGSISKTFCENLVNHTYGSIYYLEGGINAWKQAGYETIT